MDLEGLKSYLTNVDCALNEVESKKGGSIVNVKPTVGDVKISRNGRIFFSDIFKSRMISVIKNDNGEETTVFVKGLDFIDTRNWQMWSHDKHGVFVCYTDLTNPKLASKVDVRKESDSSVGFTAIKEHVIPMLIDLYKIDPDFNWIELKVNNEVEITHPSNVYDIPKVASRGKDKGSLTSVRRENTAFWLLELVTDEIIAPNEPTDLEEEDVDDVIVELEDENTSED